MESQQNPMTPAEANMPSVPTPAVEPTKMTPPLFSSMIFILVGIGTLLLTGLTGFYFGKQYNSAQTIPTPTASPDA